jgi:ABC-type nitrate/sulfonate/bicarbonate transport system permease component
MMFASLFILALISILLYTAVDLFLQKLTKWQPEDGFA